jgi:hypothetical protein
MKKHLITFCSLLTVLSVFFTVPCLAAQEMVIHEENMTLQIPSDFTIVHRDNVEDMKDQLHLFDTTVTETSLKLQEQDYLFLGISSTMRCTLFLTKQKNPLSQTIGDLITYQDKETAKKLLVGDNLPDTFTLWELERNGALFYRVDCGVTDGVGRIVYITVMNGVCYTLGVVDNNGKLSDNINALIDTVFNTWDYTINQETQKIEAFRQKFSTVVFAVGLPLSVLAGGFIIFLLVKDIQHRRVETQRKQNIPKKPRR